MHFHTKKIDETLKLLETGVSGLSSNEARKRLEKYGPNILPSKRDKTILEHFLLQFKSPIIYILHIPFMQNVLSIAPVSFGIWLELAGVAIILAVVMEIDKWLMLKQSKFSRN